MYKGSAGVGGVLSRPLAGAIVKEVVTRANLERRTKGRLKARIRDREMEFVAREYDHFGESAFEIRVLG